jgi:hypothetical protein
MSQAVSIKTKKESIPTTKNNVAAKPKTKFHEDFENALTVEEARALSLKHVRSLRKK